MAGRGNTPLNRQNEYFVPRDGIDREVITADICRYLGNDALVRPGTYENKETGQLIQGYYINAYRNLTTAMIDDLKEASRQWQLERTRAQSGGAYRHSETHHRQQAAGAVGAVDPAYGNPTPPAQYYSGPGQPQYSQPVANNYASQGYANAPQGNYGYQTSGNTYSPPPNQPSRYPPPQAMPQSYTPAEQPYLAGSNLGAAPQYAEFPREQPPRMPSGGPARVYASAPQQQSGYPAPAPAAGGFYSQPQQGQPMYAPVQVQPQDPFYGRGGGAGQYDDSASPTTQTQSDRVAGQANQNYSPEPMFEDNPSRTMPPSAAPAVAPAHNHKPDERHQRHHQTGRR